MSPSPLSEERVPLFYSGDYYKSCGQTCDTEAPLTSPSPPLFLGNAEHAGLALWVIAGSTGGFGVRDRRQVSNGSVGYNFYDAEL